LAGCARRGPGDRILIRPFGDSDGPGLFGRARGPGPRVCRRSNLGGGGSAPRTPREAVSHSSRIGIETGPSEANDTRSAYRNGAKRTLCVRSSGCRGDASPVSVVELHVDVLEVTGAAVGVVGQPAVQHAVSVHGEELMLDPSGDVRLCRSSNHLAQPLRAPFDHRGLGDLGELLDLAVEGRNPGHDHRAERGSRRGRPADRSRCRPPRRGRRVRVPGSSHATTSG